jgi:GH25 family lysozyme M1 (1,4-beta-N-acetylmuramidase)
MARGIDIHPGNQMHITSWSSIKNKANIDWVYVKASDGDAPYVFVDQAGGVHPPDTQVRGAKGVDLPVGVYHYAEFGDPVRQADVLLGEHRRLGATLPPMLDLEKPFTPNDTAKDFGIRFCKRIRQFQRPVVYMNASMAGALRPDQWDIPGLLIWIAAYGANTGRAYDPDIDPGKVRRFYSGRYDIHQHTSTAKIAGLEDRVDLDFSLNNELVEDDMTPDQMIKHRFTDGSFEGEFGHTFVRIAQASERLFTIPNQLATLTATVNTLSQLLAAQHGLTAEQVQASVKEGVAKALAESKVD